MHEENRLTEHLDGFATYMETSTRLQPVTRQRYCYEVAAFAALIGNPALKKWRRNCVNVRNCWRP